MGKRAAGSSIRHWLDQTVRAIVPSDNAPHWCTHKVVTPEGAMHGFNKLEPCIRVALHIYYGRTGIRYCFALEGVNLRLVMI